MIKWLVVAVIFGGLTGLSYLASAQGWGLSGMLDKPVSVRQQSSTASSRRGMTFIYFGSRRHSGGGFRGGK